MGRTAFQKALKFFRGKSLTPSFVTASRKSSISFKNAQEGKVRSLINRINGTKRRSRSRSSRNKSRRYR